MRATTLFLHLGALSTSLAAWHHGPIAEPAGQFPFGRQHVDRHLQGRRQIREALDTMMDAIAAMQDNYFSLAGGTWTDAIDWTRAVIGTHVSATLSSVVTGIKSVGKEEDDSFLDFMAYENIANRYFAHTTIFYFNENALSLYTQAFDDMLWVVLGWLENVKFSDMYSEQHPVTMAIDGASWHGTQIKQLATHRARVFYELASKGWDTTACGGGMDWNPTLEPYKNAITNELFMSASIAMYLYFPGDNNTVPFKSPNIGRPHHRNQTYLDNAVKAYKWLVESNMTDSTGLYEDGYHITGWKKYSNGTINHGTGKCDSINTMVYTYNQGVILTSARGLWMSTGNAKYLEDGHQLIRNVINATGYPAINKIWRGLGRGGVMEDDCDHALTCSQDAQIFKAIFFHHFTEFCRPLWPSEERLVSKTVEENNLKFYDQIYMQHLRNCETYGDWVERNAAAALRTRNSSGLFGMWWGVYKNSTNSSTSSSLIENWTEGTQSLPIGADDYRNPPSDVVYDFKAADPNDRGRGRTVETQAGGLAVLRARWQWRTSYSSHSPGLW